MIFTSELLLPRIKSERDSKLENFIVRNINKELRDDEDSDPIQMQYFFLEMYQSKSRREKLIKVISKL